MSKVNVSGEEYLPLNELERIGVTGLGTGTMVEYVDKTTKKPYYFKYARNRYTGEPQPYKANKSEIGYKIQRLVDENTAVKCKTITLENEYGSIQEKIKEANNSYDLRDWQIFGGEPLPKCVLDDLLREFVTDYLLCNFDAHGGNFITRSDGKVIGIDKEQSFKYLLEPKAKKLSYRYHPNEMFGELEPIYNTMFRRYVKGAINLDLDIVFDKIREIEKIDDNEYREIFRKNVELKTNSKTTSEEFLDKIVERKDNFYENFRDFVEDLNQERIESADQYYGL